MTRLLRNHRVLAGLALVLGLFAVALWPRAVPVDLDRVTRGPLEATITDEGKTRVRERFTISAPVAGHIGRIGLEPGDAVSRDVTVLATFRPEEPVLLDARSRAEAEAAVEAARAAVGMAEAERERAAATAALARSEAERYRGLAEAGVVSRELLETRQTAFETADEALRAAGFAVDSARHELERVRARLSASGSGGRTIELRSPIDGVVLQRFRESEGVVRSGEPLIEVADPVALEIVADLLSSDAVRVRPGQAVHVERWGGDRPLAGRVRRVEPFGFTKISALGVEEQRVNVLIDFEDPVEAWRVLGDGYRVEVRVVVWSAEDVLRVPSTALFRHGETWAAFVVDRGRARLAPVQIGERSELAAEVRGGLAADQVVVAHPGDRVADGVRVSARE